MGADTYQSLFASLKDLPHMRQLTIRLWPLAPPAADAATLPALDALKTLAAPSLIHLDIDVRAHSPQHACDSMQVAVLLPSHISPLRQCLVHCLSSSYQSVFEFVGVC